VIVKIFSPKKLAKMLAIFTETAAIYAENIVITLVFKKTFNFLPQIGLNSINCVKKYAIYFCIFLSNLQ
jgi:hypothetical protein